MKYACHIIITPNPHALTRIALQFRTKNSVAISRASAGPSWCAGRSW